MDGPLAAFNEDDWYSLVDYATVYSREDIRFTFKTGWRLRLKRTNSPKAGMINGGGGFCGKREFYCLLFFFILTLPVIFSANSLKTFV